VARYRDAKCRLCRREGAKLFLKGERCFKPSCAIEKRGATPPGQHGRDMRRNKVTGYGEQLREKQKVKRIYGMLEKQFRNVYAVANSEKGITGENLLRALELRLDNVVFRGGFAASRNQARQFVRHGHVLVNGKRVTIPSYQVKRGDAVEMSAKAQKMIVLRHNLDTLDRTVPMWLEVTADDFKAVVRDLPLREQIDVPVREQLIVELYSK